MKKRKTWLIVSGAIASFLIGVLLIDRSLVLGITNPSGREAYLTMEKYYDFLEQEDTYSLIQEHQKIIDQSKNEEEKIALIQNAPGMEYWAAEPKYAHCSYKFLKQDIERIEELRGRFDSDPNLKTLSVNLNPFSTDFDSGEGLLTGNYVYVSGKNSWIIVDGAYQLNNQRMDIWGNYLFESRYNVWVQSPFGVPDPYDGYLAIDFENCTYR